MKWRVEGRLATSVQVLLAVAECDLRGSRSRLSSNPAKNWHWIQARVRAMCVPVPIGTAGYRPMDHIRKIIQRSGNPIWQLNLRKYNLGRPQFETKEAAEAALADAIKKRGAGLTPGRRDVTFAEQAEAFLANAADALAESTLRSYRGHLKVHILPHFGQRRVVEINAPMIKAFLTEKRQPIPTLTIVSANPKKPRAIE